MAKRIFVTAALILAGLWPAIWIVAAAESQYPELSEKELEKRCDAALRDLRAFCSAEVRPQKYWSVPAPAEWIPVQQKTPRPPNPGSERPVLPRSQEDFDCLDARLRVDKYCFKEKPASGETLVLKLEATTRSLTHAEIMSTRCSAAQIPATAL